MRLRSFVVAGFAAAVALVPAVLGHAAVADGPEARTVPTFSEELGSGVERCPVGQFCWYNAPFYNQGQENWMWRSSNSQPDLGRSPGSSDEAESVVNRTDEQITLYEHWRYGRCVTVPPGGRIDDLDAFSLQNNVTSIHHGNEFSCPSWGYVAS
ncbi:Peptidase inhibitor family I36 [Saccharopolyspora antimicrobica]|uniref:Peptidase inhibitor family I36 n=1 Tax=Saccharopolyspora antimicrobica TaxID=455193 RepID=A0A1I4Z105_9PSEU|nr:peptidase inhibitor family I36 protein [Saccharopolyspora antimicrobica]RKT82877.1 peptidase inhibitor family I36 [Saccharopolyspora antimicrobica]SFN43580.1 Peptidase inhibitor family I36 [Saccharopolyspora antimicrobica]